MDMPAFKIASADLTCKPLLERVAKVGKPVILSTGTSTLAEIDEALETLAKSGCDEVVLLHCTLKYPCPPEGINLRMMTHMMQAFPGIPVGLSDHSLGISIPQAAVALGACVIEKHYTIDKTIQGSPDHHLSVDPGRGARDDGRNPHHREGARQIGEGPRAAREGSVPLREAKRHFGEGHRERRRHHPRHADLQAARHRDLAHGSSIS